MKLLNDYVGMKNDIGEMKNDISDIKQNIGKMNDTLDNILLVTLPKDTNCPCKQKKNK